MSLTMGSATNFMNTNFHKANKLIKTSHLYNYTSHLYNHPGNELKVNYALICYTLHKDNRKLEFDYAQIKYFILKYP